MNHEPAGMKQSPKFDAGAIQVEDVFQHGGREDVVKIAVRVLRPLRYVAEGRVHGRSALLRDEHDLARRPCGQTVTIVHSVRFKSHQ